MKFKKLLAAVTMAAALPFYLQAATSTPSNVVLAQEYIPSKTVLSNIETMLSLFQPPKGNDSQMSEATQVFKKKVVQSLSKFIQLIEAPEYTAFLKERDKVRQSALNEQGMVGGFANAYSNNAPAVDAVNKQWEQIKTAVQAIASYETLVASVGENSEVKLRDRLAPIANVILKIVQ